MAQQQYTAEFKTEAVLLATSGEKRVAQTARELGFNDNTLYAWVILFGSRKEGEPEPLTPQNARGV